MTSIFRFVTLILPWSTKLSMIIAKNLSNFQLSVDFFDRPEICAVTVEHGIKGQAATIMLLCAIYKNGYFFEWKPENYISILKELPGIKINKMPKIVKTLVEWGFFDRAAFEEHQVLTSREIQQQYMASQEDNLPDVASLPYWLTDDNGEDTEKKLDGNKENAQQSQVNAERIAASYPANPDEYVELAIQNIPRVREICARHNLNLGEVGDWLRMFAKENEGTGKETYNNCDDLLDGFDHWLLTVETKT